MVEKSMSAAKTSAGKTVKSPRGKRGDFFVAALDMSWQLIVVILVPIIGGFELDKVFNSKPTLVIIGFIIAVAASTAVMWLQLKKFAPKITQKDIDNARKIREREKDD